MTRMIRAWNIMNIVSNDVEYFYVSLLFLYFFFLTFKSIQIWITILIYMLFHKEKYNYLHFGKYNVKLEILETFFR